jgi:hypothetical protein
MGELDRRMIKNRVCYGSEVVAENDMATVQLVQNNFSWIGEPERPWVPHERGINQPAIWTE